MDAVEVLAVEELPKKILDRHLAVHYSNYGEEKAIIKWLKDQGVEDAIFVKKTSGDSYILLATEQYFARVRIDSWIIQIEESKYDVLGDYFFNKRYKVIPERG